MTSTDCSVLKSCFTCGFLISRVGVDSKISTKYGLLWGENEVVVWDPLGRVASLYDEGPEGPLFPSAPPADDASEK